MQLTPILNGLDEEVLSKVIVDEERLSVPASLDVDEIYPKLKEDIDSEELTDAKGVYLSILHSSTKTPTIYEALQRRK